MNIGIWFLVTFELKIRAGRNLWLELEDNIDKWMGNNGETMTASDRRILITLWVGEAFEELKKPDYDNMRRRCFEKTGCLLTADGSQDELVQPEGLKDYRVIPPLPMPGPEENAQFEMPEPAQEPLDTLPEDDDNIYSMYETVALHLQDFLNQTEKAISVSLLEELQ